MKLDLTRIGLRVRVTLQKQKTGIEQKPREIVVGYAVGRGIEGGVFAGNGKPCADAERIG